MPSSIKLSVNLIGKSHQRLTDVGLGALSVEQWKKVMEGMSFSSPNPVMTNEDLAMQIEGYIEHVWGQRYGGQQTQLQVQVFKITDANESKEFGFQDEVEKCFRPGDTVGMDLHAVLGPVMRQGQGPVYTEEMLKEMRKSLRFDLNDRVLCYCGPRWFSGHVVGSAVPDDEDELLPYLVKTDAIPGLPSRTISVPYDKDNICVQEVCFDPEKQLNLVRCATPILSEAQKKKLRFTLCDKVVCRICSDPKDGLEVWVQGTIAEIWPKIGEASWDMGEVSGKFPDAVPYKVNLASGQWVYCHRDDHTLIRKEGMQPVTRVKGISKRMEIVTKADGSKVCIDHVTGRQKRMIEEADDSD